MPIRSCSTSTPPWRRGSGCLRRQSSPHLPVIGVQSGRTSAPATPTRHNGVGLPALMAVAPALRRVPGLSSVLLLGHQLPVLGKFEPAFLIQRSDGFCGSSATLIRILAELICAIHRVELPNATSRLIKNLAIFGCHAAKFGVQRRKRTSREARVRDILTLTRLAKGAYDLGHTRGGLVPSATRRGLRLERAADPLHRSRINVQLLSILRTPGLPGVFRAYGFGCRYLPAI